MPTPAAPLADLTAFDDLLQVVFDVSLTPIYLLRPLYEQGALVDFVFEYMNPATQRLTGLSERASGTMREHFPDTLTNGVFAFYQGALETGEAGTFDISYRANSLDYFFRIAAKRSGELLVVSFTDTTTHDRSPAEEALLASQAREQNARTAAERERNLLQAVLKQAPVAIGLFQGEQQVVATANDQMCALWGHAPAEVLGHPLLVGVPELRGQGFAELIAEVARTQVPFVGTEVAAQLLQEGELATHYFNFVYQPLLDLDGSLLGVLDIAIDVTAQVQSRQQVVVLNEKLAKTNAELQLSNQELLTNSEDLLRVQQQVELLHQASEARVVERTQEAIMARATAERHRARLERLFQEAPAAICLLDGPDLVFDLVNPGYQELFPGRELLGKPVLEALPELVGQAVPAMLRGVYETGVTFEGREVLMQFTRPNDGQLEDRYFNFIYQARYNEEARIDGLVVFAFEITEQVRGRQQVELLNQELEARVADRTHEAQLARSEAEARRSELQRVFEQTPVAIATYRGPNYVIELANPTVCQLWGRTQEQLIGRGLFEALPEVAGQGFEELLDEVMATGIPHYAHEMPAVHDRNGRRDTVYWNFVYQPLREADDQITGAMVVATEVTEQVLARHEVQRLNAELESRVAERTQQLEVALRDSQLQQALLAEQRLLLSHILRQVPAAIATLSGPEHRFSFFNAPYQALSANRTQLDQTVAEVFPEIVSQGFVQLLDEVYTTGQPFIGTEMPAQLHDATTGQPEPRFVDFTYQPLRSEQGQTLGILAFILDVTDKVQARRQVQHLNQTLQTTNERLRRTNADLDTFVYAASHDLKAPITNVEGLLDALREHLPATVQQGGLVPQLLSMMQGAVERFKTTIAQLTDVSRIQHMLEQPEEAVELDAIVEGVRLDLAPLLETAKAQLTVELSGCPIVHFSAKNLRSIVYNLLSNAVKYRAPDRLPVVCLRCFSEEGQTILEVQDNGLGLNAKQQSKLFTMFRRLHDHVEGSGVGLYMVKKMVENASGTITVQSQPGVGSTFRVALPQHAIA